ncbi:hypothetical protein BBO99_00008933 [Phytophthora kernoviae]|nr:hypothetical protein BBI17_009112 [Phytophthora kernoviae]RLN74457.1 hypothetical protein BBO99_00008933 [Phytophthora kernoviae]
MEDNKSLTKRVMQSDSSYRVALRAFNELRSRGEKLEEKKYLSLLYKASREGRYKRVWECYKAFQEDERLEQVKRPPISPTTWPKLTSAKMNMHRFVMWALLDEEGEFALTPFYQQEVVGKPNALSIHEADPLNFLLHLECQGRVGGEQQQGLRQRVETLLNSMEHIEYRTSHSAAHAFFRLILHRPDIFLETAAGREGGQRGGDEANDASVLDRLEVERSFDRQYPGQRTHLNSIILNICQANDDFSTMLIQRLQEKGGELTPSTDVIVDGVKLSYMSILVRYRGIITWDAWTIGTAVIRSGMRGLQADVIALMAEADSRDLVLDCTAYSILLSVLEAADEPSAVIACAEKMKAKGVWEKTANKYPQRKMVALRKEVQELETEYARTIERKRQPHEFGSALDSVESRQQSEDLVEKYTQLIINKEALRRENKQMALIASKHAQFDARAQRLLISEGLPSLSSLISVGLNSLAFEPLTLQECHEIASEAYRDICAFLESNNYLTTGAVLCGWRDQRHLAPDHVKFTLTKRFTGTTPIELSTRAWHVTSSTQGLAGLYSPTMCLSLKRLQVVDEHNVIMYRVIPNAHATSDVQSLFLVSYFHVERSYIVLFRSVNHNKLRYGDMCESGQVAEAKWLDMFTW